MSERTRIGNASMRWLGRDSACGLTRAVGGAHGCEADIVGLRLEVLGASALPLPNKEEDAALDAALDS